MGTRARWNAITPDTQEKAELNTYVGGGPLLHVQDQEPSGTLGGGGSTNSYTTRDLNTVVNNEIAGASLSSNQITLPAGEYQIEAYAPAYRVNAHKLRLRNITDGINEIIGGSHDADNNSGVTNYAPLSGRISLGAEKVLELQHYTETSNSGYDLGLSVSAGIIEVFADVQIRKIG